MLRSSPTSCRQKYAIKYHSPQRHQVKNFWKSNKFWSLTIFENSKVFGTPSLRALLELLPSLPYTSLYSLGTWDLTTTATLFSDILPPKLCNTIPISTRARSCWRGLLTMFSTLFWVPTGSCPLFFSPYLQHTSPILFFKPLLGPFLRPQGILPTIFEFPFSRCVSLYFFQSFDLFSHFLLHGIEPPDDYWNSWW